MSTYISKALEFKILNKMKTDVWGIKEVADITLSVRESRMGVSESNKLLHY